MNDLTARAARSAARAVEMSELTVVRTGWKRAAEIAGLAALGMLAAVGVIPW
ncbi:hypothetical protein [Microbacterium testaceum]|uniref:hypothetical protein n=1 Tax=Microbacterium testaceum TaxID=2033 RepID=UPI0015E1895B|nr:hypothetical protein [Microbacterium testaceum]